MNYDSQNATRAGVSLSNVRLVSYSQLHGTKTQACLSRDALVIVALLLVFQTPI